MSTSTPAARSRASQVRISSAGRGWATMPSGPASSSTTSGIEQPPCSDALALPFESFLQARPDLFVVAGFISQPGLEEGDSLGRLRGWRFDPVQLGNHRRDLCPLDMEGQITLSCKR